MRLRRGGGSGDSGGEGRKDGEGGSVLRRVGTAGGGDDAGRGDRGGGVVDLVILTTLILLTIIPSKVTDRWRRPAAPYGRAIQT